MGSLNAFAQAPTSPSNGIEHVEDSARPPKRLRLADDVFAEIETRCTQANTSLEVDHMILDYTAFQSIKACLASRDPEQQSQSSISLSASLSMFDSFLSIFKARHPTYKADAELTFRIKLLKLVTLFTQRLTFNPTTPSRSDLESLRRANWERAQNWTGVPCGQSIFQSSGFNHLVLDHEPAVPLEDLVRNRAHVLQELGIPAEDHNLEDAFYGTPSCLSLLDILPLFMEVSARRNAMSASNLSERWMHLACELMLQACLEQLLVVGFNGSITIESVFAWGYEEDLNDGPGFSAEVNDMFRHEDCATEVEGWFEIKTSYVEQLPLLNLEEFVNEHGEIDTTGLDLAPRLESIAAEKPIAAFERSVLIFLNALFKSTTQPVLVQLESGKLDGMTEEDTQDFLADCGLNMARLFQTQD